MSSPDAQVFRRELDQKLWIDSVAVASVYDCRTLKCSAATVPFQHAGGNSSRKFAAAAGTKGILGHNPESAPSNSFSATLGDLCAFAVQNSSLANFAWVQHMLHLLAPNGSMALLLANGLMSSNSSGEGDIRRALIDADLVECMVALPGQLFTNTQIPACIWFRREIGSAGASTFGSN